MMRLIELHIAKKNNSLEKVHAVKKRTLAVFVIKVFKKENINKNILV